MLESESGTQLTLERIYPESIDPSDPQGRDSLEIHESRYRFAAQHLRGKRVLDLACGAGYGTALMAARHPGLTFTGIDIDPRAVEYARRRYGGDNHSGDNLRYRCADAMQFGEGPFDTIVSLETIEHLPDAEGFVARLPDLLAPGGRIIASVPITPTRDGNPHHLHDFSKRSFERLFAGHGFSAGESLRQVQPWVYQNAFSSQGESSSRAQGVGTNVLSYYRKHPLALGTRLWSLLRHGPCNIYWTAVFQASD